MDTLRLVPLCPGMEQAVAAYRAEFPLDRPQVTYDPEHIPGLDRLEDFASAEDWLNWCGSMAGKVSWFMAVKESDGAAVGCLCLRHKPEYDDDDPEFRSHIGYSVRPSERGKGYGRALLRLGLREARALGLASVRLVCRDTNAASRHVILQNGGVYIDTIHGEESGMNVERYDIAL